MASSKVKGTNLNVPCGKEAARVRTAITAKKISVDSIIEAVKDDGAGATVLFLGTVRDKNSESGKSIAEMHYESYVVVAERQIQRIRKEIRQKWPIRNIVIVHRIGKLSIGDISVVVGVSSAHRAEAFEACRYAIDRIKNVLPIWKKEILIDGSQIWLEGHEIEGV